MEKTFRMEPLRYAKERVIPAVVIEMPARIDAQEVLRHLARGEFITSKSNDWSVMAKAIDQDGNDVMALGYPRRLTVRDWTTRRRYVAKRRVKAGCGKGTKKAIRVGKGTVDDMRFNTSMVATGLEPWLMNEATLRYNRVDVVDRVGRDSMPPILEVDYLVPQWTMAEVAEAFLGVEGCPTIADMWVRHPITPSVLHPGLYEGVFEAGPSSVSFFGRVFVLLKVKA